MVCSNSSVLEKADQTSYLLCAFDITLVDKSYAENANRDRKRRTNIQTLVACLPYDPRSISVAIYEQVICESAKYRLPLPNIIRVSLKENKSFLFLSPSNYSFENIFLVEIKQNN